MAELTFSKPTCQDGQEVGKNSLLRWVPESRDPEQRLRNLVKDTSGVINSRACGGAVPLFSLTTSQAITVPDDEPFYHCATVPEL